MAACKACLGDHPPRWGCPGITPDGAPASGEMRVATDIFIGFDGTRVDDGAVVVAWRNPQGHVEFQTLREAAPEPPVADRVTAWVEEYLDVELTVWQRDYLQALYAEQPGDPGAVART